MRGSVSAKHLKETTLKRQSDDLGQRPYHPPPILTVPALTSKTWEIQTLQEIRENVRKSIVN